MPKLNACCLRCLLRAWDSFYGPAVACSSVCFSRSLSVDPQNHMGKVSSSTGARSTLATESAAQGHGHRSINQSIERSMGDIDRGPRNSNQSIDRDRSTDTAWGQASFPEPDPERTPRASATRTDTHHVGRSTPRPHREEMGGAEEGPGPSTPSPLLAERSSSSTAIGSSSTASGGSNSSPPAADAPTHARARRRAAAAAAATISAATRAKPRGAVCQACRRIRVRQAWILGCSV